MADWNDINTVIGPTDRKRHVLVAAALLAAFLLVTIFVLPALMWSKNASGPSREQILVRLADRGITAAGEPAITRITSVDELKAAKPVIYANAKNGQYEVRWQTLLVIYDYERDELVNLLSITPVQLG